MKKIIVVADWVPDSLSCQEFRSVIQGNLKQSSYSQISFVSSDPSTINTGFLVNQIQLTEARYSDPMSTIIFINNDTRNVEYENNSHGSEFIIARLISGLYVCGVNSGYSFSFIKKNIANIYLYPGLDANSQFRSRDSFARICAHLADELDDEMDLEETNRPEIPVLDNYYIGHIDNFGNIKTTISYENIKGKYEFGDELIVKINNISRKVILTKGLFSGDKNTLLIYPGSSGEKNNPFMEISIWRNIANSSTQPATSFFNHPLSGDIVYLK